MSTACGRGAVGAVALRASRAYEGRAGASARHIKKMGWARLSQSAAPRRGGARLRARRGVAIEAKIWTDDGRRRAAELMGLTREEASDEKTLKRAFRRLCLRYHPDIAREDDGAQEKFKEIQEAYRVLSDEGDALVALPDDLEWSTHDWRWAHRYHGQRGGASSSSPDAPPGGDALFSSRRVTEEERRAKLDEQLGKMAGAPTRRKRRVIKRLSAEPSSAPASPEFATRGGGGGGDDGGSFGGDREDERGDGRETRSDREESSGAGSEGDEAPAPAPAPASEECPSDGCGEDPLWMDAEAEANFKARATRGYQSDRHSTESAHERINSQLAGLHRKRVIRARAMGVDVDAEARRHARRAAETEREVKDETNSARFYGGVGLQLEESTPERFLRLAKLAKEWREARSMSDAIFSADQIKPSAKELLQAAVEGASLGACA